MNVWDVEGAAWQNGGVEPGRDLETLSEEVLRRQVRQIDAMIDRDGRSSEGWHPQEQNCFFSMWTKLAGLRATDDPKVPHSSRKAHNAAAADVETKAATNHELLGYMPRRGFCGVPTAHGGTATTGCNNTTVAQR